MTDSIATGAHVPGANYAGQLGRRLEVRYTFYAIPGGTQVTATVREPEGSSFDPIGALALKACRRQVEAELTALKDFLE